MMRQLTVCVTLICLLAIGIPPQAAAGVVTAEQYLELDARAGHMARIDAVLARAEVREQLVRLGVDPDAARERVASLTAAELAALAGNLEDLPAGGDGLLAVVGAVFVVLLILELTGVIDIFKRI